MNKFLLESVDHVAERFKVHHNPKEFQYLNRTGMLFHKKTPAGGVFKD